MTDQHKTPGQVAYEAHATAYYLMDGNGKMPWNDLFPAYKATWEAAAAAVMPQWVSVGERLPEEGEEVLVTGHFADNKGVMLSIGWQYGGKFDTMNEARFATVVTHWMPPPPAPKLRPWTMEELNAIQADARFVQSADLAQYPADKFRESFAVIAEIRDGRFKFRMSKFRTWDAYYTIGVLSRSYMHSIDQGKTWLPCGIAEPVKEEKKQKKQKKQEAEVVADGWMNVYAKNDCAYHTSRDKADKMATYDRLACVRVVARKGEGLT